MERVGPKCLDACPVRSSPLTVLPDRDSQCLVLRGAPLFHPSESQRRIPRGANLRLGTSTPCSTRKEYCLDQIADFCYNLGLSYGHSYGSLCHDDWQKRGPVLMGRPSAVESLGQPRFATQPITPTKVSKWANARYWTLL